MLSGEDEKRRARAQAVGAVPLPVDLPGAGCRFVEEGRGRLVREIAPGSTPTRSGPRCVTRGTP